MRIEIICTGDEVLTGKIVNTNFSYMTQKLEDVGLAVEWETTVGDDRENLLLAFTLAGQRADAVIVNGGLGPTIDDLSQEIAAQAAGVELVLNEGLARRRWRSSSSGAAASCRRTTRKQAMLPVDRRGDRQPDRHRLRLRARHRPRALLLHPGRAARAAPHARGADHSRACSAQSGTAGDDPPQAVPFLRARRIARRRAAHRRGGSSCPTAA